MVQTIAVSEAALVDDITAFLLEDPDAINCSTNWWHPRVKVLEKWLRDDANKASIPDDGTEEMIRKHIQRGDIYAQSQLKCWKHILLELCDIPSLAMVTSACENDENAVQTSPSRGKLRPGKELIILSDEMNQEPVQAEFAPPLLSDEVSTRSSPQRTMATAASASTKKFASLSMMERQAEWLRKKEERIAAEKQRQDEEKNRELTFQPKLIRRSTFTSDRPVTEDKQPPSARSVVARNESFAGTKSSEATETRRPPSGNIATRRGSAKPTKKKKFIPVDQRLEVQSDLLDSMKNELEASLQKTAVQQALIGSRDPDGNNNNDSSITSSSEPNEDSLGPDASLTSEAAPAVELKSWQATATIGGFRVDFDSSGTKARLVLQDASKFELSSMYRKTDRKAQREGVALHMGRREDTFEEEVIAILFDKEKVSEAEAARWWADHAHRFSQFTRARDSLASAVAALVSS